MYPVLPNRDRNSLKTVPVSFKHYSHYLLSAEETSIIISDSIPFAAHIAHVANIYIFEGLLVRNDIIGLNPSSTVITIRPKHNAMET